MANKTLFKTPYGEHERVHVTSGTGMKDVWEYQIDNFGRKVLVKTGEENLYEQIQASLEETKIENVLARAVAGENVFRPDGIYADLTDMPSNLIEARQAIQKLENTWATLSQETRNKYNNSVEDFIAASGTESWLKDMGLIKDEPLKEMNEGAAAPATAGTLGQVKTTAEKVETTTKGGATKNE